MVTPIGLLPEVRRAVGEGVELILDGGIRRGTDIFKALALGANIVLLDVPIFMDSQPMVKLVFRKH